MALSEILRRNRLQQKDVADALGVSRVTVGAWVHGDSIPSGTNLTKLVDYLRQFDPTVTNADIVSPDPEPAAEGATR